jgi:hypothetical protein
MSMVDFVQDYLTGQGDGMKAFITFGMKTDIIPTVHPHTG